MRETCQSSNDYNLWLLLEGGHVISGSCECTADDGGCKHIAAFLFSLASFTDRHRDRHTLVGTDQQCAWDHARRESAPMEVDDIDVRRKHIDEDFVEAKMSTYNPVQYNKKINNEKYVEKLLKRLAAPDSLAAQYLSDSDNDSGGDEEDVPQTISNCVEEFKKSSHGHHNLMEYLKSVHTPEACILIEEITLGQSDNPEWPLYRCGRVTSTIAHQILHLQNSTPDCYVVNTILGLSTFTGNQHTQYGQECEPIARQLFVDMMRAKHVKLSVVECGIITTPTLPQFGASVDGKVICKCCPLALIEIKTVSKNKHLDIGELCSEDSNIHRNCYISADDNSLTVRPDSPWENQMMFAMGMVGAASCYLVVYTAKRPYIHVAQVQFKNDRWDYIRNKCTEFYNRCVIPRLLAN